MEETIFSKILRHEIPADIVYEDDHTLAFLDINPLSKGEVLVIPKEQSHNVFDITPETWGYLMEAVRKLTPAITAAMDAHGVNIIMNNEPAAGQIIFHSHIHIIPRHTNDKLLHWTGTPYLNQEEQTEVAKMIRTKLSL